MVVFIYTGNADSVSFDVGKSVIAFLSIAFY